MPRPSTSTKTSPSTPLPPLAPASSARYAPRNESVNRPATGLGLLREGAQAVRSGDTPSRYRHRASIASALSALPMLHRSTLDDDRHLWSWPPTPARRTAAPSTAHIRTEPHLPATSAPRHQPPSPRARAALDGPAMPRRHRLTPVLRARITPEPARRAAA